MIAALFAFYISTYAFIGLVGWRWQASKSPEVQHLEYLIDSNDPYASAYAAKLYDSIPVMVDNTGRMFALL